MIFTDNKANVDLMQAREDLNAATYKLERLIEERNSLRNEGFSLKQQISQTKETMRQMVSLKLVTRQSI